jgi:hypothetical protein
VTPRRRRLWARLAGALALWVLVSAGLGLSDLPDRTRLVIAAIVAVTSLGVFALCWWRPAFRAFALGFDLRLLTWLQLWRVAAGAGLLTLYQQDRLHWRLGLSHGVTALVVGLTAPIVAREAPSHSVGRLATLFFWHVVGAGSLVMLLTTAIRLALQGDGRGAVLLTFPWSLVATFLGPAAVMTHAAALAVIWRRPLVLPRSRMAEN